MLPAPDRLLGRETLMTTTLASRPLGSVAETHGMRVSVTPQYVADQSDPQARQYLFTYRVGILNNSEQAARLMSRHWIIVDAQGVREEVRGPGVVGQQPRLEAGQSFEYSSFCPLKTSWGTMEGIYHFQRDDGSKFEVTVGRFYLVGPRIEPRRR